MNPRYPLYLAFPGFHVFNSFQSALLHAASSSAIYEEPFTISKHDVAFRYDPSGRDADEWDHWLYAIERLAPQLYMSEEALAAKLTDFVEKGAEVTLYIVEDGRHPDLEAYVISVFGSARGNPFYLSTNAQVA